jgi:Zn-dependent protease with chaperone function
LPAQLAWQLRALTGTVGYWWLVSLAPIGLLAFDAPLAVSIAAGALLLAWNHFYGDLVLAALGATPLRRADLDAAFEPVLARVRVPPPRILRAGPRGARIANAFALSSPRGDVVLFFDTLLEHATPAEAAGVLAHELGHLEDFATRRAQLYAHGALLALGVPVITLIVQATPWLPGGWVAGGWTFLALGSLVARVIRSQHRETESDRRAVELCGDGEALVRALLLLHSLGLVPRRVDPETEQHATHPSLARRIRAIRQAAGVPPDVLQPRAIAGAESGRVIVFERERLAFVTVPAATPLDDPAGVLASAVHLDAIAYADLGELRLEPDRRSKGAVVVAADRAKARRRFAVAEPDVPVVQAMLDLADQRMTPAPPTPVDPASFGRLLATMVLLMLLASGAGWPTAIVALAAIAVPTPAILAATAVAALVSAVLPGHHPSTLQVTVLLLGGLGCGGVAWMRASALRDQPRPSYATALLVLQLVALAYAALWPSLWIGVLGRTDLESLQVAARAWSPAAAGWMALGTLLLFLPRRTVRAAGAAAIAVGVAVFAVASDPLRDRLAPDPLIAAAPSLEADALGTAARQLVLDGTFVALTLSPDARHVLLADPATDEPAGARHVVAGFDGWRRIVVADQVRFADADTLLALRHDGDVPILTAEGIRDGAARWTLPLPGAPAGTLDADASGRWRLAWDPASAHEAQTGDGTIEGRIGDRAIARIPPPSAPLGRGAVITSLRTAASGAGVAVRRHFRSGSSRFAWVMSGLAWSSEIARSTGAVLTPLVRTRLDLHCFGPSLASGTATCLAGTGDETFVWHVDADRGSLRPLARTTGTLTPGDADDDAWLVWRDRELLLLRPGAARALRISDGSSCPCPYDAAVALGHVATLTTARDRAVIDLYPLSPAIRAGR